MPSSLRAAVVGSVKDAVALLLRKKARMVAVLISSLWIKRKEAQVMEGQDKNRIQRRSRS